MAGLNARNTSTHPDNSTQATAGPELREGALTSPAQLKGKTPPSPQQSQQGRNKAHTRRNSAKVEQYLMDIEKAHGFARSWELRERLERGDVTLEELQRR